MKEGIQFIKYLKEKYGFKNVRQFFPRSTIDFHEFYVAVWGDGEKVFLKTNKYVVESIQREGEILQLPLLKNSCYYPDVIFLGKWREISYVALEFIEGTLLKETLKKPLRSHLPVRKMLKQLIEIGFMLQKEKLVHRDIRPGNIIIQWGGEGRFKQLVLIDFAFSVGINRFPELSVLVDNNMLIPLGTRRYKPDLLKWDNFYSIEKIAKRLDKNYRQKYLNEAKLINRNIGKLVYEYK